MTEAKGTKELTDVIDLALAGVDIWSKAKADGHIGVEDAALLLGLIPVAGPAVDGIGEIPAELADLSAEEAAEVVTHVMAKLTVDDAKAKAVIEASLKFAVSGYGLVKAIKG